MSPQEMSSRAIQAAADLACELNIGRVEPEVLHISQLLLADLRSLCVAVWCWARYDIAEKRDAANVHLAYLRTQYASPQRFPFIWDHSVIPYERETP
jgi:hypothetical protein